MSVTKGVGPTLRVLNADEKRQVSRAQFLSDHPVNFTGWDIEDGSPTIWLISESALYFIALRSQGATKEGTVAYRFRGWLFRDV
jgi:prophage antirepressor-like protein